MIQPVPMAHVLTVFELATFTGLPAHHIRYIIRKHHIKPQGYDWKQRYYPAAEVLRHTGLADHLTVHSPPV